MVRPGFSSGTRLSSWISRMEYYLGSSGVRGEVTRLTVAASFLDLDGVDRFTFVSEESQRPQTLAEMKEVPRPHFNAVTESGALETREEGAPGSWSAGARLPSNIQ